MAHAVGELPSLALQVFLDPALTDHHIAAAAAIFPAASRAVLHLPNWIHLPCNVYDSSGAVVTGTPLGRRSIAANAVRRAALLQIAEDGPEPPSWSAPSRLLALQRCLDPEGEAVAARNSGLDPDLRLYPDPDPDPPFLDPKQLVVYNTVVETAQREASAHASCWSYPASLVPPEEAVKGGGRSSSQALNAAERAAEREVVGAHRLPLDLAPLVLPAEREVQAPLAYLDLRCPVDLAGLVVEAGKMEGGGGGGTALTAGLTGLTAQQLRDGGQLAVLRQLTRLASLELWCCDVSGRMDASYWTSAAPQRIRRGLPALAAALTALTALVVRELVTQVEPPPPVAALAALPLLRSLTLELLYSTSADPWQEMAEMAEQLEEEGEGEGEGEEEEPAVTAAAAAAALDACISEDMLVLGPRASAIKRVIERHWRQLRAAAPLDLFSCFAPPHDRCGPRGAGDILSGDSGDSGDREQGNGNGLIRSGGGGGGGETGVAESSFASCGGGGGVAATVPTHGSLTHLDVTFLGVGLLPGAWHGICHLAGSLTRLALRVGRSPREERLIANLLSRYPGRWPPGSFSVPGPGPALDALPHLRHLMLDVPLEPDLAASLVARELGTLQGAEQQRDGAQQQTQPQQQPQQPQRLFPPRRQGQLARLPALETLSLVGMWSEASSTSFGKSTAVAAESGAASASSVAYGNHMSPPPSPSWPERGVAAPAAPVAVAVALRTLHLEGDLRHLVSDMAAGVLCATRVVDLRLAHRPAGRATQWSEGKVSGGKVSGGNQLHSCSGGDAGIDSGMLQGRLPLQWALVPPGLQALELEGFDVQGHVGDDDDAGRNVGSSATDAPCRGRGGLCSLERLRLRHCVVALDGVYDSPLTEVAVQACWLTTIKGGGMRFAASSSTVAAVPAVTAVTAAAPSVKPLPPWDVAGQLQLLCQQPWAPRLLRLDVQLVRLPYNLAFSPLDTLFSLSQRLLPSPDSAAATPCYPGSRPEPESFISGSGTGFRSVCTARLHSLEHLSITWELAALSGRVGALQQRTTVTPTTVAVRQLRVPRAGLTVELAAHWVAALSPSLRSLELWLADEAQEEPLSVDSCCGPWLLRHRNLRRLRLVLLVSCDRGAARGSAAAQCAGSRSSNEAGWDMSRGNSNSDQGEDGEDDNDDEEEQQQQQQMEGCVKGYSGRVGEASRAARGSCGGCSGYGFGAAAADPPSRPEEPRVASAWAHAELADLLMTCMPYCQCQAVQIRLD
ncbi:hypothetical protein VOLCADRAFT_89731 [Volvox carteri f. nagariensis]|uniref:Uncharacterized protein n=1 Tax=Volvox carteri f. nagariensis TaxID=3068 RepID=D8TSH5_VOLCA|nr:uncharacterized protein VOLCADRAFT_89731 [Volvox carteri f. nagariensis]EFJ49373.1 hypothetical protein VOLCADRAFT_89731 [Volvox carteri f. nagariensis]|eukprot:XP_002949354.1 hypothetical protein VOLCADRAFT_89731 [Volvox carteri f. nagariensis]